jgi:Rps23 Pro-64 3,4-dihydroxylase Tpa1-like proline 4-hydroxylase
MKSKMRHEDIANKMRSKLEKVIREKEKHSFNIPFCHYVVDNFMDDTILNEIGMEELVECSNQGNVRRFLNEQENKIAISHIKQGKVYEVLKFLNSPLFVMFLETFTGISDLIVDNDFHGGGIHMIPRDGKLGVHIDFSRAIFDNKKYRRLNVLLYLNKEWLDEYNGHLELWDNKPSDGGVPIKKILPIFNRLVIFGTKKGSWHGHPTPLTCPENRYRISLATYYYSNEPGDDIEDHSTIF